MMTHDEAKQWIQHIMDCLIDPSISAEDVGAYFSKNYKQDANGVVLDYTRFLEHARVLKSTLKSGQVSIDKIFVDGSTIVSVHYVNATKQDDSTIRMKVIACFGIENGKIASAEELTYLMQGDAADHDLGSRV
ncbi:nuclear transport factor 2 family protein [Alicyclobacillus suci]|uniref:nuclear transport factor 2 family protein n=1 Tax=Alicyclobacillus suci TaxID=2816080 RepID=UPI001A8E29E0|nr:nuclear transport factor 2 family protein [Alicyclobacillus suci]